MVAIWNWRYACALFLQNDCCEHKLVGGYCTWFEHKPAIVGLIMDVPMINTLKVGSL